MGQSRLRLVVAALFLAVGSAALWSDEPAKPAEPAKKEQAKKEEAKPPPDQDIIKDVQEWNSEKFVAPPTKFRQGNVTPRELDQKAVNKLATGFEISLPSGAPVPTPTVYKGNLYVSGGFHSKEFYCFDAVTGKFVWGINLDDDGPTAAVCDDDIILFNTESCTLFAVDAKTGKHIWSHWLGDPLTSTPTIANGKVFTSYPAHGGGGQVEQNMDNQKEQAPKQNKNEKEQEAKKPAAPKQAPPCSHVLAAFELKTGKILWQRWIESDVMSAPVAVDKELYATSFGGVVYKLNQEDGKVLSAVKSRATSAPVVVGKDLYVTRRNDDGKGAAREAIVSQDREKVTNNNFTVADKPAVYLDNKVQALSAQKEQGMKLDAGNGFGGGAPEAANAKAAGENVGQDNVSTMQAFQGSRILNMHGRNFNCMGDEVICTDAATGKEAWKFQLKGDLKKEGGFLAAPPAAAGGQLFLVTLQGDVVQMDPKEGKEAKTYKVGHQTRFQPAIEGGKIYVGTQNGKVVCIDTGNKDFTGWPCWGGNPAHTGLPTAAK